LRGATTNEVFYAIATDFHFRAPAMRLARAHARTEPRSYGYMFAFPSPQLGALVGTPHAMEIPILFGTFDVPPMPFFLGDGPMLRVMCRMLQDVWIAFARTGDPSTEETGPWPRHDAEHRPAVVLDEDVAVEQVLPGPEMDFWAEAFAALRPVSGVDFATTIYPPPTRSVSIMPPGT
jgi:carboxylesterase type B